MVSTPETPTYIVVPISRTVLFPESNLEIEVNKALGSLLKKRMDQGKNLAVALAVKEGFDPGSNDPDTFFSTGTLIELKTHTAKGSNDLFRASGRLRVTVQSLQKTDSRVMAVVTAAPGHEDMDLKSREQMLDYIKDIAHEIAIQFKGSESYAQRIRQMDSIPETMTYLLPFIPISMEEKQRLLETDSLKERGIAFMDILLKHKTAITLQIEMAEKFSHQSNERYRKAFLKEQLKQIHQELDEDTPESKGKKDYARLIKEAGMPGEVEQAALEELSKLNEQGQGSHEAHIIKNYLDLLVALPWQTTEKKDIDIDHAEALLDSHHHGQEKIKERILEHLSVMKLKKEKQGSILLLAGPPGTGKTSLGAGIAKALDRKYVRISLGGVSDEAEIRGHRRTYIGALPGRIIQGMKKAGEKNPVFVLDEVDKLVSAFHGDPSSALLEVLDPEQNISFSDHYLEVPYDLSDVFFIATANDKRGIPAPLLDRMEVIDVSGYTAGEKLCIAKDHLLKRVFAEHGIKKSQLEITEDALKAIIEKYTVEAGVRALRQQLARVAGFASRKIVSGTADQPYIITQETLEEILGHPKIRHDAAQADNPPGVVTGLAWTPIGGEILFIEAVHMPGTGRLTLTGQLGDVMKESATISMGLFRSRLAFALKDFDFQKNDLHIHIPAGALPKDGPSAGVAMFTAITSLIMGRKINPTLAMTGEITLRGHILPVGGIKEKVLAAHRAGLKTIILPEENKTDLTEIPEDVREQLTFVTIHTVEDLIRETIGIDLPKPETLKLGTLPENLAVSPVFTGV
ncbi:endopeptidase La [Desulfobacter vibrioformis]|uniref:endopeptidase La n=1 Tax=Desulfobacter vibrioformis TaxID=34031 RepID=UPI000555E4AB|nr:endopeptidase La [Desulfobacter vibrioformis]